MEWDDLTKEQQRAFNRFKKAYKDCKKAGVYFANNYGTIVAYDSDKVEFYINALDGNSEELDFTDRDEYLCRNSFSADDLVSWTDDTHGVKLTDWRRELYSQSEDEND